MEWGLLWTPLLPEIFNLTLLNNLKELVQLSSVNKVFRAYFQQEERTIYLNFLTPVLDLNLTTLTLEELRLLLRRGSELFGCGEVNAEILGVLNNPDLLPLLPIPEDQDEDEEAIEHLLDYAAYYDNYLTYDEVFRSRGVETLNMRTQIRVCIRQGSLLCFQVIVKNIPDRVNAVYFWALVACNDNHALALTLLKTAPGPFDGVLQFSFDNIVSKDLQTLLKYPKTRRTEYLELVAWLLDRLPLKTFRKNSAIYLMAAGASQQTLEQLFRRFILSAEDEIKLRRESLLQLFACMDMCSREEYPVVCARIESLWR